MKVDLNEANRMCFTIGGLIASIAIGYLAHSKPIGFLCLGVCLMLKVFVPQRKI